MALGRARDPGSFSLVATQSMDSFLRSPLSKVVAPTSAITYTCQLAGKRKREGKEMLPPLRTFPRVEQPAQTYTTLMRI